MKTVEEGNKLIIDFMEYSPKDYFKSVDYDKGLPVANWPQRATELCFHTSWDCLMPVVEKLEKLKHPVYIHSNCCTIYEKSAKEHGYETTHYGKDKIEATWNAVVFFIITYINLINKWE